MANFDATAVSGGSAAGGVFNLSDAALIALILAAGQMATDTSNLLVSSGSVTITADETWGVVVG
jgi:hypothetical protein